MKKLLLGTAMSLAMVGYAAAADMPIYSKAPPPPPWSWTGFYVGLQGGAGWGNRQFNYNDVTPAAPFLWSASVPNSGALVGGQIGFNWQAGWAVLGIEADGDWADLQGKSICNTTTFFLNCAAKTDGLATFTGRLGVDFDRMLLYVKGGGAWMHENSTISNVALPPLATAFSSSLSDSRYGWTLGMGIEYAFARQWSAKLEYDYADFGTKRYNFPAAGTVGASNFTNWDLVDQIHTVKAGVNYHF
jgi:outer membrane immunogenic protein